jgi:type I restriction enzyme R subunit
MIGRVTRRCDEIGKTVFRKANKKSEFKSELKQKLDEPGGLWGVEPKQLHKHLTEIGPEKANRFVQQHTGLLQQLNEVSNMLGSEYRPIISEHVDEFKERTQSYGVHERPEDYLDSFNQFIKAQLNQSVALAVVVNKPRDLSRKQLKEIKLLLDSAGYSEAKLQSAIRSQTNQDIAASIVGHIRRAALGEALIPFDQRVAKAIQQIFSQHNWLPVQRKWLERLAKQLTHEVIIDRDFVNQRFAEHGGAKQLDKVLVNQHDVVLDELSEAIWAS